MNDIGGRGFDVVTYCPEANKNPFITLKFLKKMTKIDKCFPCLFFSLFSEGPPKFGRTPDSRTIG
jgi:hypothetical protein